MNGGEIKKEDWNRFVLENGGLFLQSWGWGDFQESLGRKIWRLWEENEFAAMIVRYNLPLGKNYLYCPGGPIISKLKSQISNPQLKCQNFLEEIKNIAVKEKSIFLKIEPFWEYSDCHSEGDSPKNLTGDEILKRVQDDIGVSGFIKSDGIQRIKKTLILDLTKSEEELLAEMKQKTRYNIKVAEKHRVKIRISSQPGKDAELFWNLAKETSSRDNFRLHPRYYYLKQITFCHPESANWRTKDLINKNIQGDEIFLRQPVDQNDKLEIKLFLADHYGEIIAANIVVFFGSQAIYLHGASSNEFRNLMAPYLLQWEQIKEAKKRGYKIYDFWGIDEEKWPGITKFKKGFGGKEVSYIGAYDYVFDRKWYFLYNLARRIKKC